MGVGAALKLIKWKKGSVSPKMLGCKVNIKECQRQFCLIYTLKELKRKKKIVECKEFRQKDDIPLLYEFHRTKW